MKPLLTLIFVIICSLTWGQDWEAVHASIVAEQTTEREIRELKPITLDMLLDYSKECYNDSTYEEYTIVSLGGEPAKITQHPISKYTHIQPTFAGFIEWLERKYLEEQP